MNDEKIFKISIITTIIGLLGLIMTTGYVMPESLMISEIDNSKIDNQVEINGIVESYTITKTGTKIVKIYDNSSSINIVIFPSTEINFDIKNNMNVTVVGKITQYNGQLELIVEESKNFKIK